MRALLYLGLALLGCSRSSVPEAPGKVRLVFVHQPLWGPPAAFNQLLEQFRRENPQVELLTQQLPNDSDVSHQFFLTALEGRSAELDVLVADVVWVPEFARAGWIADLSSDFPPDQVRREF